MKTSLLSGLPKLPPAPTLSKVSYLARLSRLWDRLADDSVCILVSNPERTRSNDTEYPYRQSSDLVYFNGFPEPDAVLVIAKLKGKQRISMLCRPRDAERETWNGYRLGTAGAKREHFCSTAHPVEEFDEHVAALLGRAKSVYYQFGINPAFDEKFGKLHKADPKPLLNPAEIIAELRLFKSDDEIQLLRHTCRVTAEAHKQAMLACEPGRYEYELQAVIEFVFKAAGAVGPAYGSIVAAGKNACVLHYVSNQSQIADGDLVLIDAGSEMGGVNGGYAGDITRTFPANGKFSKAQREIYQLVLDANLAAIELARPGVPLIELHRAAEAVMQKGLVKLGILPEKATAGKAKDAASKPLALSELFMHGTSHWLGLDVHDVGHYDPEARGKKQRLLEPGMVFTIEPGLYLKKNDKRIPARYRGIGVRIEDDVLITKDGHEVLTADVPKSIEGIEALMDRRS